MGARHLASRVMTFALLIAYSTALTAGLFGYDQGMTRATVKKISKGVRDNGATLTVQHPPITNEKMQSVTLHFSKKTGLCFIHALGKPFAAFAIEHEFEETAQVLSARYGKPTLAFEPHKGVRHTIEPRDWYKAVREDKGTLIAMWPEQQHSALPDKLRNVRLSLTTLDLGHGLMGALFIGYGFSNHKDCLNESRSDRSKGL